MTAVSAHPRGGASGFYPYFSEVSVTNSTSCYGLLYWFTEDNGVLSVMRVGWGGGPKPIGGFYSVVLTLYSLKYKTWPELRHMVRVEVKGTNCFRILVSIFKVYPLLCHLVSFSLSLALLPFLSQQKVVFCYHCLWFKSTLGRKLTFSDHFHVEE